MTRCMRIPLGHPRSGCEVGVIVVLGDSIAARLAYPLDEVLKGSLGADSEDYHDPLVRAELPLGSPFPFHGDSGEPKLSGDLANASPQVLSLIVTFKEDEEYRNTCCCPAASSSALELAPRTTPRRLVSGPSRPPTDTRRGPMLPSRRCATTRRARVTE